jgi:putative lipoic acid-binding regulatory protein
MSPSNSDHPVIASDARKESLIEYPSRFPIKVMGANVAELVPGLIEVAKQFDADFEGASVELRPSRAGKYLGVTLTINATSREQLDDLYRALTSHPLVKVVL